MDQKNFARTQEMVVFPLDKPSHFLFQDDEHHCQVRVITGSPESLPANSTHFIPSFESLTTAGD